LLAQFWLTFKSSDKDEPKLRRLGTGIQGIMKMSKVKEKQPNASSTINDLHEPTKHNNFTD
jgi:hypothetical protein